MADNNDDISNNRLIRERYHKLTALKEAGLRFMLMILNLNILL